MTHVSMNLPNYSKHLKFQTNFYLMSQLTKRVTLNPMRLIYLTISDLFSQKILFRFSFENYIFTTIIVVVVVVVVDKTQPSFLVEK